MTRANQWTERRVRELEAGYTNTEHREYCRGRGHFNRPRVSEKYISKFVFIRMVLAINEIRSNI